MMADERFLCMKGKAGLGNRMLAAISGLLYARLSGRTLVVDWSDFTYSNDGENVFPLLFTVEGSRDVLPDLGETSVTPPIWIGRLDASVNDLIDQLDPDKHSSATIWRKHSIDLARLDHPERVAMLWSFTHQIKALRPHFKGSLKAWAALSDDAIIARVLRDDMRLNADIAAQVAGFKAENFAPEMIGVHVRYMDRRTSLADFLKHLDRKVAARPDAAIFLATDNSEAEAVIRGRYARVVTTPKWFPEGGVSMHQNPECPDRLRNAIEALIDMYLLAECDHLIFPGSSTFSKIASLISPMPRANVIDIERFDIRIRAKRFVRSLIQ